jgi:hypothetical protein
VRHVLGQHCREMATVDDQHPVQQFAADSCDPPFGNRICPSLWVPNRSSASCGLGIFMYQPTESVATLEVRVGLCDGRGE